jgi:hypothetical protein
MEGKARRSLKPVRILLVVWNPLHDPRTVALGGEQIATTTGFVAPIGELSSIPSDEIYTSFAYGPWTVQNKHSLFNQM